MGTYLVVNGYGAILGGEVRVLEVPTILVEAWGFGWAFPTKVSPILVNPAVSVPCSQALNVCVFITDPIFAALKIGFVTL